MLPIEMQTVNLRYGAIWKTQHVVNLNNIPSLAAQNVLRDNLQILYPIHNAQ